MRIILPTAFAAVLLASPVAAADRSIECPRAWGAVTYRDTPTTLIISCAKPPKAKRTRSSLRKPVTG